MDVLKKENAGAREAIRWLEAEFQKGNRSDDFFIVRPRAVSISLFANYSDTAYSRLLKQPTPIMKPIMCEICLVNLFTFEALTYYCNAQFAQKFFPACVHHDINGGWVH